ncbi:hypothetical protein MRX96_015386 [Rhipicephalus microplus]
MTFLCERRLPATAHSYVMRLIVILLLTISQVSAGEYSVIMAEADNSVHQFCMVYFSEFKELPESPERMPYIQMVNLTSQDGCKKLQSINLHGKVALIKDSGNCTLDKVVLHYKAAQAYGIVISTQKSRVDNIIINRNDTRNLDIVVGFVTDITGNSLLSLMKPKEPLLTKLFTKKSLAFDYSLIIIWLVAVFTLGVGSYWSGLVKHEIYQHEIGKCSHTSHAGAEGEESSLPKSENVLEEESSLDVSPVLVTLFVICMGVMLLLLYFFFQYLVFFIIGMFALASVVSVIGVLEPLIYKIPIGTTRIPRNVCPCFHGPPGGASAGTHRVCHFGVSDLGRAAAPPAVVDSTRPAGRRLQHQHAQDPAPAKPHDLQCALGVAFLLRHLLCFRHSILDYERREHHG